ncbi:hypothetical protein EJ06DRAFT_333379 [Trichodelitschia bisporula]|uniref:Uncharacterized protein n=1 Tax=Trichodelitschia bisporula TaxID=703511 RepID=A0A6G1I1Y4_9PEZI|nr:hypothetical protein EJ06DRAFT_333379 [Trichodelitschia bisporula]
MRFRSGGRTRSSVAAKKRIPALQPHTQHRIVQRTITLPATNFPHRQSQTRTHPILLVMFTQTPPMVLLLEQRHTIQPSTAPLPAPLSHLTTRTRARLPRLGMKVIPIGRDLKIWYNATSLLVP